MPVTHKGSTSILGTNGSIPIHGAGDLILVFAVNQTSNSSPPIPTAGGNVPQFLEVATAVGGGIGVTIAYAFATTSTHTSGVWTGSTRTFCMTLTGESNGYPIGSLAQIINSSQTELVAPAISLLDASGESLIVHLVLKQNGTTSWSTTPPTGYTYRTTGTTGRLFTKDSSTSDGEVSVTVTSGSVTTCLGVTVEILADRKSAFFGAFT
jgi:hypothetical protein